MEVWIQPRYATARLDPATLAAVDEWRAAQCDMPARNEAVRRLIEAGLDSPRRIRLSDGEKLLVRMLGELLRGMKVEAELKPDFIDSVMAGGHYWALGWEHPEIFHRQEDSRYAVKEVVDILDMWTFLEEGLERLPAAERERVDPSTSTRGGGCAFAASTGTSRASI